MHFYLYAGNSPPTFSDPFGLEPEGCKDCQGRPKQGVQVAKSCCGNESPMSSSAPNPYSSMEGYLGVSAQQMFWHGGDSTWGKLVRGCLACMYLHGADPASAHEFCYLSSASRAPLSSLPGLVRAVGAAGVVGAQQGLAIGRSLASGQPPPFWSISPIIYSFVN
jgi:hypothetical protein